jgi:hypothetical protein
VSQQAIFGSADTSGRCREPVGLGKLRVGRRAAAAHQADTTAATTPASPGSMSELSATTATTLRARKRRRAPRPRAECLRA